MKLNIPSQVVHNRIVVKAGTNVLIGEDDRLDIEVMEVLVSACEAEGITTVMVTHDESLTKYATRVVRLDSGKIISDEAVSN